MKQIKLSTYRVLTLALSSILLHACGPQAFVPVSNSSNSLAGNMILPAKVDIVMGISATGSMSNIYPGIHNEIPSFVQGLQNSGWDYRFVTLPLTQYVDTTATTYSINHAVSTSHYDSNYYPLGTWLTPYPGAVPTTSGLGIASSLFSQLFVFPSFSPPTNDGHETGIHNEVGFLQRADIRTNFLRPDAMLAVITLSNYDDKSGGTWGTTGWSTSQQWTAGADSSIPAFEASLLSIKGSTSLLKYYSMVAHNTSDCWGVANNSRPGIRYEQIATDFGTTPIDICTNTLDQSLSRISSDLQGAKLNFEKIYLIIGNQPNISTIQVTKYIGGNSGNAQIIPQDATNGWTYSCPTCSSTGYGTVYTIDQPVNMDQESGYVISLHGTARLHGNDTANVTYMNH